MCVTYDRCTRISILSFSLHTPSCSNCGKSTNNIDIVWYPSLFPSFQAYWILNSLSELMGKVHRLHDSAFKHQIHKCIYTADSVHWQYYNAIPQTCSITTIGYVDTIINSSARVCYIRISTLQYVLCMHMCYIFLQCIGSNVKSVLRQL